MLHWTQSFDGLSVFAGRAYSSWTPSPAVEDHQWCRYSKSNYLLLFQVLDYFCTGALIASIHFPCASVSCIRQQMLPINGCFLWDKMLFSSRGSLAAQKAESFTGPHSNLSGDVCMLERIICLNQFQGLVADTQMEICSRTEQTSCMLAG